MFAIPLNIARVVISIGAVALIGVAAKKVADHRSIMKSRESTETPENEPPDESDA